MNLFLLPSISIEYYTEYTGVRIAWLWFMILIQNFHKDENGSYYGYDDK